MGGFDGESNGIDPRAELAVGREPLTDPGGEGRDVITVSYTHLTLPTSDLV